jgi:hypothetical protein
MSGAIGATNPYLLTLFPSSGDGADSGSSLLSALYGSGGAGASGDPVAALNQAEASQTQDIASEAAQPAVARATAEFTKAVTGATSVAQLLADPNVLNVLLTANGLGDQVGNTALAVKALTSDLTDPNSLANVLPDTTWKTVATTYGFAATGLKTIQTPSVIATLTSAYAESLWRQSLDAVTPGLSEALTFRSEASGITSVDQILGDLTLRTVVTTALGIPEQIAFQDIGAQEDAITSQLDIKKFQDPKYVEQFTQRYLVQAGIAAAGSSTSTPDLTSLAVQAAGLTV